MDSTINKPLLLILTLSSLLLSSKAIPASRVLHLSPSGAPTGAPTSKNVYLNGLHAAKTITINRFNPQILKFCTGTENPQLCASTIAPVFLPGRFDPIKALQTEIQETLKKAKLVADLIAESLTKPGTNAGAMDALQICKTQYGNMLDTIKEAVDLVAQHNVVDAYYKFSAVISYKSTCDDAFMESPGVNMPFAKDTLDVFQLGGNCLAIMDGIVNNNRL